jgi:hypothetical protein
LLTLSYLAPEITAPLKVGPRVNVPAAFSLSAISILNWIFPDFSIDTLLNVNITSAEAFAFLHFSSVVYFPAVHLYVSAFQVHAAVLHADSSSIVPLKAPPV